MSTRIKGIVAKAEALDREVVRLTERAKQHAETAEAKLKELEDMGVDTDGDIDAQLSGLSEELEAALTAHERELEALSERLEELKSLL